MRGAGQGATFNPAGDAVPIQDKSAHETLQLKRNLRERK